MPNSVMVDSVEEAEKKIQEIEESLKTGQVMKDIIFADSPMKSFYQYWAKQIEVLAKAGKYKKSISTICAYITQRVTDLGFAQKAQYVRQSLPFKYKDSSRVRSQEEEDDLETEEELRKISSIELSKDEEKFLKLLILEMKLTQKMIVKFSTTKTLSELPKKQLLYQQELMLKRQAIIKSCMQIIDGRIEVPLEKQFLFFHARTLTTLGDTYDMFVKFLKKFNHGFTTKQVSKIAEGRISKILLVYEPKNRFEAMNVGYYGMPCGLCGSWRCHARFDSDQNKDRLFCYANEEWSDLTTIKLPGSS